MYKRIFFLFLLFPFLLEAQVAMMHQTNLQDTICSNVAPAKIGVDFSRGTAPYTIVYSINNVARDTLRTSVNDYFIPTKEPGYYQLLYFSDSDTIIDPDSIQGTAVLTVNTAPIAIIYLTSDTLSVISPTAYFFGEKSVSPVNINSYSWYMGANGTGIYQMDVNNTITTDSSVNPDSSLKPDDSRSNAPQQESDDTKQEISDDIKSKESEKEDAEEEQQKESEKTAYLYHL